MSDLNPYENRNGNKTLNKHLLSQQSLYDISVLADLFLKDDERTQNKRAVSSRSLMQLEKIPDPFMPVNNTLTESGRGSSDSIINTDPFSPPVSSLRRSFSTTDVFDSPVLSPISDRKTINKSLFGAESIADISALPDVFDKSAENKSWYDNRNYRSDDSCYELYLLPDPFVEESPNSKEIMASGTGPSASFPVRKPYKSERSDESDSIEMGCSSGSQSEETARFFESRSNTTARSIGSESTKTAHSIGSEPAMTARSIGSESTMTARSIGSESTMTARSIESESIMTARSFRWESVEAALSIHSESSKTAWSSGTETTRTARTSLSKMVYLCCNLRSECHHKEESDED